jgi:hypothetical protein
MFQLLAFHCDSHKKHVEPIMMQLVVCVAGAKVDQRLCAWLAVLVLPVNSALNPVIYTLTTSFFKNQVTCICFSFLFMLIHFTLAMLVTRPRRSCS